MEPPVGEADPADPASAGFTGGQRQRGSGEVAWRERGRGGDDLRLVAAAEQNRMAGEQPRDLAAIDSIGAPFDMMTASFFLGRQKLVASPGKPGMALWRERLFAWMSKSSESAMEFFRIPTNRVVELGSQLQL